MWGDSLPTGQGTQTPCSWELDAWTELDPHCRERGPLILLPTEWGAVSLPSSLPAGGSRAHRRDARMLWQLPQPPSP